MTSTDKYFVIWQYTIPEYFILFEVEIVKCLRTIPLDSDLLQFTAK